MCQLACSCHFTDLCQMPWQRIRYLIELQCKGCDTNSSEHLHACQKLYMEYYLIDQGYLRYFFKLCFDQVFGDGTGCTFIYVQSVDVKKHS